MPEVEDPVVGIALSKSVRKKIVRPYCGLGFEFVFVLGIVTVIR
jgi:hypothetical protein